MEFQLAEHLEYNLALQMAVPMAVPLGLKLVTMTDGLLGLLSAVQKEPTKANYLVMWKVDYSVPLLERKMVSTLVG